MQYLRENGQWLMPLAVSVWVGLWTIAKMGYWLSGGGWVGRYRDRRRRRPRRSPGVPLRPHPPGKVGKVDRLSLEAQNVLGYWFIVVVNTQWNSEEECSERFPVTEFRMDPIDDSDPVLIALQVLARAVEVLEEGDHLVGA